MGCISNCTENSSQRVLRELYFGKIALVWTEEWVAEGKPGMGGQKAEKR